MSTRERILAAVHRAIDEINRTLPQDRHVPKEAGTPLLGKGTTLESLTVVNLAVEAEIAVEEEFGRTVLLTDARAASQKPSPFRTIGNLVDYVEACLAEGADG